MEIKKLPIQAIKNAGDYLKLFQSYDPRGETDARIKNKSTTIEKAGLLVSEQNFEIGQELTAYYPGISFDPTLITLNGEPCYCASNDWPYRIYAWKQDQSLNTYREYRELLRMFGKNEVVKHRLTAAINHLIRLRQCLRDVRKAYDVFVAAGMEPRGKEYEAHKKADAYFMDNFVKGSKVFG